MLGKRFLASAYVVALSYSLLCGLAYSGEPIKQVAKNNPSQSQPYSKVRIAEIDIKQERRLDNSKLDKITKSNNSPIPWGGRGIASREFNNLTLDYMQLRGVNLIVIERK